MRSSEIDRRGFCQLLASCVAGLAFAGCTDDGDVIHTGPLDTPDGPSDDPDGALGTPDAGMADASGATCGGGEADVGAPTAFTLGTATLFLGSRIYVVRDAGGLFAVSSQCTHHSSATNAVSSGHFRCPRHGAQFTFDGAIISGPVNQGLVHFALCTLPNGHVGVDTTMHVPAATRLDA